jgi:hypothetical protein
MKRANRGGSQCQNKTATHIAMDGAPKLCPGARHLGAHSPYARPRPKKVNQ